MQMCWYMTDIDVFIDTYTCAHIHTHVQANTLAFNIKERI